MNEQQEKNRKAQSKISLRLRLTALVTIVLLIAVSLVTSVAMLIDSFSKIDVNIPVILTFCLICLVVAVIVTLFMSKWFFNPIKKLSNAIKKVATGDFNVHIETESSSKEMNEIYSDFHLMVEELKGIEILQSDFVSNVSHEFKTPISAIEGYATLLQDCDNLNDEQRLYVEKINFNTRRLSRLTANILLLSKIENQHIPKNQTVFRLDEQIRQSIVMSEPSWDPKNIQWNVEMEESLYQGSESLLYHVWDNLIGNAIKFSPEGGEIRISLKKEENSFCFKIEDDGPGISPEAEKHLFDKFYQQDSSHKEEGNGLGLALAKRIIDIENGSISVYQKQDGGCGFSVKLAAE